MVMFRAAALILLIGPQLQTRAEPPPATRPTTIRVPDEEFEGLFLPPPPGSLEVLPGLFVHAQVTAFREGRGEKPPGKPADVLRLSEDPAFGVHLLFFPTRNFRGGEVRYREVLTLPAKPGGWGEGYPDDVARLLRHKRTISADGRACTTEITFPMNPGQMIASVTGKGTDPDGDEVEHTHLLLPYAVGPWGLAEDDPPGEWTIEAFLNDKPVARATFRVVIQEQPGGDPSATPRAATAPNSLPVPAPAAPAP